MTARNALNAEQRARDLEQMTSGRLDVLVVGGGITGAGIALDAATRGLRVGLVEAEDYASGTSRWSSKMIHGGLRYLATGQFGIAMESARERHLLLTRIAPHLVRPRLALAPYLPSMSPTDLAIGTAGLVMGDTLRRLAHTPSRALPGVRRISRADVLTAAPCLVGSGQRGGIAYWDGELEDDARLVLTVLRSAAVHGAMVANYAAAQEISATDAEVRDVTSGRTGTITARVVINATGVWTADLDDRVELLPSRGSHLVLRTDRLGGLHAFVSVPIPGERGRYGFIKPYADGLALVGITDEPDRAPDRRDPVAPPGDVDFLLGCVRDGLRVDLPDDAVVGSFAGLRPLIAQAGKSAPDTSRDHVVLDEPERPITVVGGKLTAYRAMAQDAVDHACARLGIGTGCRTAQLPLIGAADRGVLARLPEPQRLVRRYGTLAGELDALMTDDPDLGERVLPDQPFTHAELAYAVSHEGALTPEDIVGRRVRLGLVDADAGRALGVATPYAPMQRLGAN